MFKQVTITVGLTLAVLSIFLLGAQILSPRTGSPLLENSNADFQRTVTVTGEADVTVKPDSLQTEIGVVSLREKLQEAITENNEKMAAVIAALKELGIAEKDIQTVRFDIQPERASYDGPIIRYRVINQLRVTVRDLNRAGEILNSAIAAGANDITGIRFATSNVEELEKQARLAAIADAMSKARAMVEAAGAKLGPVLTINTTSYSPPVYDRHILYTANAEARSVPIEAGELQLKVTVQVVYAIE